MRSSHNFEDALSQLLSSIGEDPARPGLRDTPLRVKEWYEEFFWGVAKDPVEHLAHGFQEQHSDPVLLRDIPFFSMCEHHLLPFFGFANLAYIPNGWIAGNSRLVAALETLAHRPQLQERLTRQTAETLIRGLAADGAAVILRAEHLCMTMKGTQRPKTVMVTVATRGNFQNGRVSRNDLLELTRKG